MSNSFIFVVGLLVALLTTVGSFTKNNIEECDRLSGTDPRN